MNMWMLLCKKFHPIVVVYFTVMSFETPTIGGAAVLRHKLNFYQTANTQCRLSVDSRTICKSRKYSLSTAISLNQDITPQNGVRTISKSHLKTKNSCDFPRYSLKFWFSKDQLILKCPFGVYKSSKKPTKFFPRFLT